MVERLDLVKYILIGGSILSAFLNLIDYVNRGAGLLAIFFYSGTLLIIAILLIFIDKDIIIPIVFYIGAILMFAGDMIPGKISPSILLFGYALYLVNNKILSYITYILVALAVTSIQVFNDCGAEDVLNMLLGYAVFFALNELIYNKRLTDVKAGG